MPNGFSGSQVISSITTFSTTGGTIMVSENFSLAGEYWQSATYRTMIVISQIPSLFFSEFLNYHHFPRKSD
jgi:hypothetical protein